MGNFISSAIKETAENKGRDFYFKTPAKELLWLLTLGYFHTCSRGGSSVFVLFCYFVVLVVYIFLLFSFSSPHILC